MNCIANEVRHGRKGESTNSGNFYYFLNRDTTHIYANIHILKCLIPRVFAHWHSGTTKTTIQSCNTFINPKRNDIAISSHSLCLPPPVPSNHFFCGTIFCVWLLGMLFSKFIHVIICINTSILFMAELYYMYSWFLKSMGLRGLKLLQLNICV